MGSLRSYGGFPKAFKNLLLEEEGVVITYSVSALPSAGFSLFCGGDVTLSRCRYFFNKSRMASSSKMFKRRPCCVARIRISLRRSASTGPPIWGATWCCSLIEIDANENIGTCQRLAVLARLEPKQADPAHFCIERLGRQVQKKPDSSCFLKPSMSARKGPFSQPPLKRPNDPSFNLGF